MNTSLASLAALIVAATVAAGPARAETYKSPEAAVEALVAAAKANDASAAETVLGKGSADIVVSGDDVADQAGRAKFVSAYDAKHQIELEGAAKAALVIGDKDYPFAIVDAENEYASGEHGAGVGVYAQSFLSSEGKKDGLYWPSAEGESPSPLGPLVAVASAEGYTRAEGAQPYHGYLFKILTRQGSAAPGGAADYLVNGRLIGGFALLAYPAQYRNSGVMTFIANYKGEVYQKDFGYNTPWTGGGITAFNPDKSWTKVDTSQAANWASAQ
jgi:hypothetical protein